MTWSKEPNRRRGVPEAQRRRIFARHGTICHICGHSGAEQIDHVINVRSWITRGLAGSPHRDSNLRPAHDQPCPACGRRCHVEKTQTEARAGQAARRTRPVERHPGQL